MTSSLREHLATAARICVTLACAFLLWQLAETSIEARLQGDSTFALVGEIGTVVGSLALVALIYGLFFAGDDAE